MIVSTALLVPSVLGMIATSVNYDILSYLPEDLESMVGEKYLENDFNLAATAMITVEHMTTADLLAMKAEIAGVSGVDKVIWQDDLLSVSVPAEMLPEDIRDMYERGDATLLLVTFKDKSSSLSTMNALSSIEKILRKDCWMGGLSAILADTKALSDSEMPVYVVLAGLLSLLVLFIGMNSWIVPFLFLLGIVYPILYNMGSNLFLGQVSYITKALAAVLQLGVTMDFSIFLMHRFDEECKKGTDHQTAMISAIQLTFSSIMGSSLTTIAGFLAMCTMSLALGTDIGIVMAKGVLLGVVSTVTILPAMILFFDGPIHRHTHRVLIPSMKKSADWVVRRRWVLLVLFALIMVPFVRAEKMTDVYYALTESLPADLPSVEGTNKLKDTFDMATTHFVFVDDSLSTKDIQEMIKKIEKVGGVTGVAAMEKLLGASIPEEFIPQDILGIVRQGGKKMIVVNTNDQPATEALSLQLDQLDRIVKSVDPGGIITGEGAMTRDLVEVSDRDFKNVNLTSIAAVFLIIALVFKSVSVPVLLVAVIEAAITINMGIPYFTGTAIPFIASIVIGTIQLGATVDYAILMTTRFREVRANGLNAKDAALTALQTCSQSIITSGLTFFSVNMGVAFVSRIELISGLCRMIARGAIISVAVILLILPPILILTNRLIEKTSIHWISKA